MEFYSTTVYLSAYIGLFVVTFYLLSLRDYKKRERVYNYDNDLTGANTGWIGSGYMNAGIIGMFLYSIIIGLFMALLNAYSRIIDKRIIVAIIVGPIISLLLSADLPTAFLNHGVLLSLFLFSLFSNRFHGRFN